MEGNSKNNRSQILTPVPQVKSMQKLQIDASGKIVQNDHGDIDQKEYGPSETVETQGNEDHGNNSKSDFNKDDSNQDNGTMKDNSNVNEDQNTTPENKIIAQDLAQYLAKIEQSISFADGVHLMHTTNIIKYTKGNTTEDSKDQDENSNPKLQVLKVFDKIQPADLCVMDANGKLIDTFSIMNNKVKNGNDQNIEVPPNSNENNSGNNTKPQKPKFILPLPFNKKEYQLLTESTKLLNDEEKATIIWNAVEREQLRSSTSCYYSTLNNGAIKTSDWAKKNISRNNIFPASSSAILNSLFLPLMTSGSEKDTTLNDLYNGVNSPADIVLLDAIDAIVSYYSINPHRVDMVDAWNGGNNIVNNNNTYAPNNKIKKGLKLCGSLLRWCQRMQLNNKQLKGFPQQYLNTDSPESSSSDDETYIYFITQVMRLVAAKWREGENEFKKIKRNEKRKFRGNKRK